MLPEDATPANTVIARAGKDLTVTYPDGVVTFVNWYHYGINDSRHAVNYKATFKFHDGTVWTPEGIRTLG